MGQGLGEAADAAAVAGFVLDLAEHPAGAVRPLVHVETWQPPAAYDGGLSARLAAAVQARLLANSADFRAAAAEDAGAGDIEVRLHEPGTGPFAARSGQIKRRYVR